MTQAILGFAPSLPPPPEMPRPKPPTVRALVTQIKIDCVSEAAAIRMASRLTDVFSEGGAA